MFVSLCTVNVRTTGRPGFDTKGSSAGVNAEEGGAVSNNPEFKQTISIIRALLISSNLLIKFFLFLNRSLQFSV